MEFKRPEGLVYPLVYDSFKLKVEGSDEEEEFVIQDLTENFFDDAVDVIVENHAKGAVLYKAAGMLKDEVRLNRIRKLYLDAYKEKISLICVNKKTQEIVGINSLYVRSKAEWLAPPVTDDPKFVQLKEASNFINTKSNIMEHYGVDRVVFAAGLCIRQKFRGHGIATRILKARAPLLKAIGLNVTCAMFTTVGGQKSADAAGYELLCTVQYDDLQKMYPGMDFSHVVGGCCKVMALTV